MKLTIDNIVKAARESGFMHHCTGLRFDMIDGKRWSATLYDRDNNRTDPHGTGATTQEAAEAVAVRLRKWLDDKRGTVERDLSKVRELDAMLAQTE